MNLFVLQVSRNLATRDEVVKLWEMVDIKLSERQAKMTGICPIRHDLFMECLGGYELFMECLGGLGPRTYRPRLGLLDVQVSIGGIDRGLIFLPFSQ